MNESVFLARAGTADIPLADLILQCPRPRVADLNLALQESLGTIGGVIKQGTRTAITLGSRGIRGVDSVSRSLVRAIRNRGGRCTVVDAMGSHGGATSEGQRQLLAHLGITEETIGAPILTDMDVVELGRTPSGLIAYCDRNAAECDGILVINRGKPHTGFAEPFGSGLLT